MVSINIRSILNYTLVSDQTTGKHLDSSSRYRGIQSGQEGTVNVFLSDPPPLQRWQSQIYNGSLENFAWSIMNSIVDTNDFFHFPFLCKIKCAFPVIKKQWRNSQKNNGILHIELGTIVNCHLALRVNWNHAYSNDDL